LNLQESLTVGELSAADPLFRVSNAINSRMRLIQKQLSWLEGRSTEGQLRTDWGLSALAAAPILSHLGHLRCLLDNTSLTTQPHESLKTLPAEGAKLTHLSEHVSDAKQLDGLVDPTTGEWYSDEDELLSVIRRELKNMGSPVQMAEEIFGDVVNIKPSSGTEEWILDAMAKVKKKGLQARVSEMSWRLKEEIELRVSQGWYCVFNTLTVRNEDYTKVFETGSRLWAFYIRDIDRIVGSLVHGSIPKAAKLRVESPYHTYFGVVERGSRAGRLHIHVVHLMKEIPPSWKRDPNRGSAVPEKRIIDPLREFWPYGWSMPTAARFSGEDPFGRLGWRWPVKNKLPITAKPPAALAFYLAKYITKSYASDKGNEQWRTRMSRGFGQQRIWRASEMCETESLLEVLKYHGKIRQLLHPREMKIPETMCRLIMLKILLKRKKSEMDDIEPNGWVKSTARKLLLAVAPRPPIVARLRSLMRTTTNSNSPNSTNTETPSLNKTAASDVIRQFETVFGRDEKRFAQAGGTCHAPAR